MIQKHIQHLYLRAGFGIGKAKLAPLLLKSKKDVIAGLFLEQDYIPLELDLAELTPLLTASNKILKEQLGAVAYQNLKKKSQQKVRELNYAWVERLFSENASFREKMTLFWANVFVCRDNHIFNIQHYNNTLRKHALGNFGDFVKAISKEASMIKYLDNRFNLKASPNENFARELMELFTLGVGYYTEQDIKESARAFTGWSSKKNGDFFVKKYQHDFGEKTFLDKTGTFNGDEIIDIILEQKQCARFICEKIYRYFINPEIDKDRLEDITSVFYKDYDIANLMRYIFSSNWFYEARNIGVKIKSPIELLVGITRIVPVEFQKKKQLGYLQKMMGQTLLYPKNVAGWKGGKQWIDPNSLMFRMKLPSLILNQAVINLEEKGEFEDSFEMYYEKIKKRHQFLKVSINWEGFNKEYATTKAEELLKIIVITQIDKDTESLLNGLEIKSNKDFCIQLMSVPEYQLC